MIGGSRLRRRNERHVEGGPMGLPPGELLQRLPLHRLEEVEALAHGTPELAQPVEPHLVLDALRDGTEVHQLGQVDDRRRERGPVAARVDVPC
jgi:hypothetical protein